MAAEWAGLVSSQAKPVELYSQKAMTSVKAKAGNSLSSHQVPRDWTHIGQSFPRPSKALDFLGHDGIFVNECGNNAFCSFESLGDFQLG
ncbi:hypothetical protein TNCV_1530001 [Trichonephila clavipes]|uniref:Uncharacterized protein n=1 Tax=Trichonephila clavipes TaxID=2585209 RepID=A0A8X6SRS4_TRICX|nr:hypothetical protein TNCV_1530001 [Trichonephila clavipes]